MKIWHLSKDYTLTEHEATGKRHRYYIVPGIAKGLPACDCFPSEDAARAYVRDVLIPRQEATLARLRQVAGNPAGKESAPQTASEGRKTYETGPTRRRARFSLF